MASDNSHESLQPLHPSMKGKLDPAFEKLYNENIANTPIRPPNLEVLRQKYSALYSYATGPGPEVGRIYDSTISLADGTSLDIRVYEPESNGPWPVHLDFHGGGWGLGDLDTESHICRHICKKANVAVIDVAYRLVPENAYPTGVTDSFAALRYVHAHGAELFNIKPMCISVGGVSAGGFIALALAHMARDESIPLRLVIANTPVLDDITSYASAADSPFDSIRENEFAPTLNWARLQWFDRLKWSSVSSDTAVQNKAREEMGWLANLLRAPDLRGLPRHVVYTAGADPLRDEAEAYARMLVQNGVEVTTRRFPGVPHPFIHMDRELWQAREAIDRTTREIRLAHWDS